jgi:hypothetical protein
MSRKKPWCGRAVRRLLVLLAALSIGPLAGGLGAIGSPQAAAPTIEEFPVTTPGSGAVDLAFGSDGNLWFTEREQADRRDIATFVHYAGAVPDAPAGPNQNFAASADPATHRRAAPLRITDKNRCDRIQCARQTYRTSRN